MGFDPNCEANLAQSQCKWSWAKAGQDRTLTDTRPRAACNSATIEMHPTIVPVCPLLCSLSLPSLARDSVTVDNSLISRVNSSFIYRSATTGSCMPYCNCVRSVSEFANDLVSFPRQRTGHVIASIASIEDGDLLLDRPIGQDWQTVGSNNARSVFCESEQSQKCKTATSPLSSDNTARSTLIQCPLCRQVIVLA